MLRTKGPPCECHSRYRRSCGILDGDAMPFIRWIPKFRCSLLHSTSSDKFMATRTSYLTVNTILHVMIFMLS